jgi:hypothetical protein
MHHLLQRGGQGRQRRHRQRVLRLPNGHGVGPAVRAAGHNDRGRDREARRPRVGGAVGVSASASVCHQDHAGRYHGRRCPRALRNLVPHPPSPPPFNQWAAPAAQLAAPTYVLLAANWP